MQLEKSGSAANIFEKMSVRDNCSVELSDAYVYGDKNNDAQFNGTYDFVCTYSNSSIKYLLALESFTYPIAGKICNSSSWTAKVTYMNATRIYEATLPSKKDLETYTTATTRKRDRQYWTSTMGDSNMYAVYTNGSLGTQPRNQDLYMYPAIKITF